MEKIWQVVVTVTPKYVGIFVVMGDISCLVKFCVFWGVSVKASGCTIGNCVQMSTCKMDFHQWDTLRFLFVLLYILTLSSVLDFTVTARVAKACGQYEEEYEKRTITKRY